MTFDAVMISIFVATSARTRATPRLCWSTANFNERVYPLVQIAPPRANTLSQNSITSSGSEVPTICSASRPDAAAFANFCRQARVRSHGAQNFQRRASDLWTDALAPILVAHISPLLIPIISFRYGAYPL